MLGSFSLYDAFDYSNDILFYFCCSPSLCRMVFQISVRYPWSIPLCCSLVSGFSCGRLASSTNIVDTCPYKWSSSLITLMELTNSANSSISFGVPIKIAIFIDLSILLSVEACRTNCDSKIATKFHIWYSCLYFILSKIFIKVNLIMTVLPAYRSHGLSHNSLATSHYWPARSGLSSNRENNTASASWFNFPSTHFFRHSLQYILSVHCLFCLNSHRWQCSASLPCKIRILNSVYYFAIFWNVF